MVDKFQYRQPLDDGEDFNYREDTPDSYEQGAFQQTREGTTPDSFSDILTAGYNSATTGMQSDLDYFQGLGNTLLGRDEAAAQNIRDATMREERTANQFGELEEFSEFVDNPTFGGFAEQLTKYTGMGIPYVLSTLGTGMGSAVASLAVKGSLAAGGRHIAKRIVRETYEKKLKGEALDVDEAHLLEASYRLARKTVPGRVASKITAKRGFIAGQFGQEYSAMAGSNFGENLDIDSISDDEAALRAAGVAIPQALIGVGGELFNARLIAGLLSKVAAKRSVKEGTRFDAFASAMGSIAKGTAAEAVQESTQEGLQGTQRLFLDEQYKAEDLAMRIGEAAFGGGAMGASMSGSAVAVGGAGSSIKGIFDKADKYIQSTREMDTNAEIDREQFGERDGYSNPEPQADLNAQMLALLDDTSERHSMWVEGETPYKGARSNGQKSSYKADDGTPEGTTVFMRFVKGRGTIISKNEAVIDAVSEANASDSSLGEALGYVGTRENATASIEALDADGNIVWQQAASEENVGQAYAEAEKQQPEGGSMRRRSIQEALEDRQRRFNKEQGPVLRNIDDPGGVLGELADQLRTQEDDQTTLPDDQNPDFDDDGVYGQYKDNTEALIGGPSAEGFQITAVEYNQVGENYPPRKKGKIYNATEAAREAFAKVFQEQFKSTIDFTEAKFAALSDALLQNAVRLKLQNPESDIVIDFNSDGTARIQQGIGSGALTGTQPISGQDGNALTGLASTLSEYVRKVVQQAKDSRFARQFFNKKTKKYQNKKPSELVTIKQIAVGTLLQDGKPEIEGITKAEADKIIEEYKGEKEGEPIWIESASATGSIAVNLADLIRGGQRIVASENSGGKFEAGSPLKAQREGLFRILSELIIRGYKIEIAGQDISLDILNDFEKIADSLAQDASILTTENKYDYAANKGNPLTVLLQQRRQYLTKLREYKTAKKDGVNPLPREPVKPPLLAMLDVLAIPATRNSDGKITAADVSFGKLLGMSPLEPTRKDRIYKVKKLGTPDRLGANFLLKLIPGVTSSSESRKTGRNAAVNDLFPIDFFNARSFEELTELVKPFAETLDLDFSDSAASQPTRKEILDAINTKIEKDKITPQEEASVVFEGNKDEVMEFIEENEQTEYEIVAFDPTTKTEVVIEDISQERDLNARRDNDEIGFDGKSETDRMTENNQSDNSSFSSAEENIFGRANIGEAAVKKRFGLKTSMASFLSRLVRSKLKLKKAVSILSLDGLLKATDEDLSGIFKDARVRDYVLGVAKDMKQNPDSAGRYIGFKDAHIILVDESASKNELETALVVGHELGHAVFQEELENTLGVPVLYKRLYAAFAERRNKPGAPKAYKGKHGFEEWYADQFASWAAMVVAKNKADSASRVSKIDRVNGRDRERYIIDEGLVGAHFRRIATKLAAFHKELSKEFKKRFGKKAYNKDFSQYMEEVLKRNERNSKFTADQSGAQVATMPTYENKVLARAVAEAVEKDNRPDWLVSTQKYVDKIIRSEGFGAVYGVFATADSQLRKIAGNKLADMMYGRAQDRKNKGRNKLGFVKQSALAGNKWFNQLEDAIDGDLKDPDVQAAFAEAFSKTKTVDLETPNAIAIRKWFERLHDEYIGPSNTNINKRSDYTPVVLKLSEIHENPKAFVDLIMREDPEADRAKVERAVTRLVQFQQNTLDEVAVKIGEIDPAESTEAARKLTADIDPKVLAEAGFLEDPDVATIKYLGQIVKRVEWNRNTKDERGYDLYKEELDKLTPSQRRDAQRIVEKYLGYNTNPLSPMWRNVQSVLTLLQIVALLPLATIGSLPELAGPMIASKEFGSITKGLKTIVKQVKDPEEARRLARDIGVVSSQSSANVLMSQAEMEWMNDSARAMTDGFFRITFLDQYTKFTREFAVNMGVKFIEEHANPKTQKRDSVRYLQELGIDANDVKVWQETNQVFTTPEGSRVEEALQRFVESSTLRPNAAERPVWASDPRFALVWQLKGFFYSYGKVLLAGAGREAGERLDAGKGGKVPPVAAIGGAAGVIALMGVATLPLAMMGMELREHAKYGLAWALPGFDPDDKNYFRSDDLEWGEYLMAAFSRSFAAGPMSIASQMMQATDWGRGAFGAASVALGPTAETFERVVTDGIGSTVSNRLSPLAIL